MTDEMVFAQIPAAFLPKNREISRFFRRICGKYPGFSKTGYNQCMLKRKITEILNKWADYGDRKALCIIGARQIGKTTAVRQFAADRFSAFLEINFLEDKDAASIFSGTTEEILLQLELKAGHPLPAGETLVLLDEIQECPAARTAVKFLVEDGRWRYVETGSLLGVRLEEVKSIPVGYEEIVNMYPLDFEEFLWGAGIQEPVIRILRTCLKKEKAVPDYIHQQMKKLFLTWMTIGGMPEVCQRFFDNSGLPDCIRLQQMIMRTFDADITQYASKSDRVQILDVFRAIPSQLDKQNQRFFISHIKKDARLGRFEPSFAWIITAGTALPCYNLEEPQIPFRKNEKRNLFRLFLLDTGLLCSCYENIQLPLLQGDTSLNWGSILENAAAQSLVSNGYELYYYSSKKLGEIDFVIQKGQTVHLIEMKSSSGYKSHAALNNVVQVKNWNFGQSYVFGPDNVKKEDSILYCPWYLLPFLEKDPLPEFNFEFLNLPR